MANKWDIIRVFRPDLLRPHDKYCICICPRRKWFFYINSEPPRFAKAAEYAITVQNYQITCITHVSYIDTTSMVDDLPEAQLSEALADVNRQHGSLSPTLRKAIISAAVAHGVLEPEKLAAVLE